MSQHDNKYVLADGQFDPDRCHGNNAGTAQCRYKSIPPSKYCPLHGGLANQHREKRVALANYRLQQYGLRVGELANNPEIKSLREEIGIVRMVLENIINQCTSANLLLSYTDKLSALAGQISRLIESAQKLEERNNNLLDRKVIIVIADEIIDVIKMFVKDPDELLEVGQRITATIESIGSIQTLVRA
jgi:hypothetical protein